MATKLFDNVKVNIATTGQGTVTFGTKVSNAFQTPANAGAVDGDIVAYILREGNDWETGDGTVGGSVTTMTRTVRKSSIGGTVGTTKLTLAGAATLALIAGAADIDNRIRFDATQTLTAAQKQQAGANLGLLFPPQGRLTLATGTPIMTSTVSGATSIFWTPFNGRMFPWYDGTAMRMVDAGGELELQLTGNSGHTGYHQANQACDLFTENSTGTPRLVSGPMWSAATGTRGYSFTYINGFRTNAATMTARFGSASDNTFSAAANQLTWVGTAYFSSGGQCTFRYGSFGGGWGAMPLFYLWNAYNRVLIETLCGDTTDSWAYGSTTPRQPNGNSNAAVYFVSGEQADAFEADYQCGVRPASGGGAMVGIGIDATNAFSGIVGWVGGLASAAYETKRGYARGKFLGLHYFSALEAAGAAVSVDFIGDFGDARFQGGLSFKGWF